MMSFVRSIFRCEISRALALTALWVLFMFAAIVPANADGPAVQSRYLPQDNVFVLDASRFSLSQEGRELTAGPLSYSWRVIQKPATSAATLSSTNSPVTQVAVDTSGEYVVELSVTDGAVTATTVQLALSTGMQRPLASIRAHGVSAVGATYRLDGSDSRDPDGQPLAVAWSVLEAPNGSAVTISDTAAVRPTILPDVAGHYAIQLVVTDSDGNSDLTRLDFDTGIAPPVANAGFDRSVDVGETIQLDGYRSQDPAGLELTANWRLVSRPAGSVSELVSSTPIGRKSLVADVEGLYIVELAVTNGTTTGKDIVIISAGAHGSQNVAPVAEARADGLVVPGHSLVLNGVASSDRDGDRLSYRWSILSAPAGSAARIIDANTVLADFTPDLAGEYLVQLATTDGIDTSFDTIVISTEQNPPTAIAGIDLVMPTDRVVSLDAGRSSSPAVASWRWSMLGLGDDSAVPAVTISTPDEQTTAVNFNAATGTATEGPASAFGKYDFIIFENSDSQSQVYGRALIGGDLTGQSSDYANGLGGTASGTDVLVVAGNVAGGPKNINNGGNVRVGGAVFTNINRNGGGTIVNDPTVSAARARADLSAFSRNLAAMQATAPISLPGFQPQGVTLNAVAGDDGVAVFTIADGNSLFGNSKVQSININLNGADAVVINVGGSAINFDGGNFVGSFNNATTRGKVLWNFHEATNILLDRGFSGSILAPYAHLENRSQLNGAVAVKSISHRGAVITPGFTAHAVFASPVKQVDTAVVQIGVAGEGGFQSLDTLLVTTGNIAPRAEISVTSGSVTAGTPVILSAATSSDANGDALSYRWSLLSRPEGSAATYDNTKGLTTKFTGDKRGIYVSQVIASDGVLESWPAVTAIEVPNGAPVIASDAVTQAKTQKAYAYLPAAMDVDGDTLTWTLVSGPAGMTIDPSNGALAWTPKEVGTVNVSISVSDGFGGSSRQAFVIDVERGGNVLPPTIRPVENVKVRPGEMVSITVSGSDPENASLTYWSAGQPPTARFDAASGAFHYIAREADIGVQAVTFAVTDGLHTASTGMTITVEPWPESDPTVLSGIVLDAQDYAAGVTTPVVGARVSLQGVNATTGANGRFSFTSLTRHGDFTLAADGRNATPAVDGKKYGSFRSAVTVYRNSSNALTAPILLNRLGDGETQLTEVDDNLPPNLRSCRVFRADIGNGASIALSALGLRSNDQLVAGTQAVVWAANTQTAQYSRVATGTVGPDGYTITGLTGSVSAGTNLFVTPLPVEGNVSSQQPKAKYTPSLLGEGNLQNSYSLPAYTSLGQDRSLGFVYNSVTADPRPIILADVVIPAETTLSSKLEAELYIGGQKAPGVVVVDLTASQTGNGSIPVQGTSSKVSLSISFDARALPTGLHDYQLYVFAGHQCSAAASVVSGAVFVNNRSDSPYGAGWKPSELQQLHKQPDGSVAIEEPNGGLTRFEEEKLVSLSSPELFELFDPERAEVADLDKDGDLDIVVAEGQTGNLLIYRNDGPGMRTFTGPERIDAGEAGRASSPGNEHYPDTNDVAVADFNQDGLTDYATSHQYSNVGRIHFQQTDGTYKRLDFSTGQSTSVGSGDFNGDGIPDVAFGLSYGNLRVYLGPVTSTSKSIDISAGYDHWDMDVADLNGDGFDDIVVAAVGFNHVYFVYGSSSFQTTRVVRNMALSLSTSGLQQIISAGDVDGDGQMELAVAGPTRLAVLEPVKDGTGNYRLLRSLPLPNSGSPESVSIKDVFNDGKAEVMVVNKTSRLFVYDTNSLYGSDAPRQLEIGGSGDDTLTVADFDRDGIQDFVLFYASPKKGIPDNLAVHFGTGEHSGNFITPPTEFSGIVRGNDGTYRRTYKDGTVAIFNPEGFQTAVIDSNGNTTAYDYAEGRLVTITDPAGLKVEMSYANERLARAVYSDGRVSTFEYDQTGNLLGVTQPNLALPQTVSLPNGEQVHLVAESSSGGSGSTYAYQGASVTVGNTKISYSYDANGKMIASIDERGKAVTYNYTAAGRLQSSTLPDASSVSVDIAKTLGLATFGVDLGAPSATKHISPEERTVKLTDAKGNKAEQEVNEWGAVVRTKDPLGRETIFTRNANNLVTRIEAPSDASTGNRLVTELVYDNRGNVTSKREAVGTPLERTLSYEYEPKFNRVVRMVDAAGKATQYQYDAKGNLTLQTNPDGTSQAFTYDARGLRLTMRDERANVTTNAYDDYGRLISVTDPKGAMTSYTRDAAGNPSVTVRGNGTPEQQIELAFFDSKNRRIFSIDGEGGQNEIVYDAAGNVAKTVDATKISVLNIYDDRSRLSSIADPAAGTTSVIYDANDNIAAITAADGERKTLVYDAANRVSEMTDALGNVSRMAYDVRDNVIAVTDGRGNTTTFAYDVLDRLVSRTNSAGNVWTFEYDLRDYRKTVVKPDGTRVAFEYDALGRLIAASATDEALSKRRFAYDGAGNLISASVGDEAAEQLSSVFGYDQLDRIISEQASGVRCGVRFPSWSFTYEYDALGRRVVLRDAAGSVTRYLYDKADRLSGMTLPSGKALGFSSDAAGRRTDMRFPNGLSLSARYETPSAGGSGGSGGMTGRLSSVAHGLEAAGAGGSSLNQKLGTVSYTYNVKGDITGIAETATPPRIRNSSYDAISRLVSVTNGDGELVESYTLDAEGNRLTSHMSKLHLTDPANRLVDDDRHQFEYDVNGNLIRKTVKASGLTWRYGYSAYDELVLVSRHASASTGATAELTVSYRYDALGRRLSERRQDASGTETSFRSFLYDGEHVA
ncbi:MAG: hypothetical protein DI604_25960, partial [Delftia acidovorans]